MRERLDSEVVSAVDDEFLVASSVKEEVRGGKSAGGVCVCLRVSVCVQNKNISLGIIHDN